MEDIKTNSLPNMECGMAYLAHPYAPLNRRAEIFVGAIKAENVEEAGDIALKIMKKRRKYSSTILGFSPGAIF